jgi:replicative DNA helicase
MMLSPAAIAAVIEILAPGDFYWDKHRIIYTAALDLYSRGEAVDSLTVVDELEKRGQLERVDGKSYVASLFHAVPATANAAHYARIVTEMAVLRALIEAGREIAALGWDRPGETADLVARAQQIVFDVEGSRSRGELTPFKTTLTETFERVRHLYETREEFTGLRSGFVDLDRVTAGFQPSNLVVIAARPAMGKSAFALTIAAHVALREEVPCAFFSLEMSQQEIAQRLICMQGKVDSHAIRSGKLTRDDWPRLVKACSDLERVPLYVDDTPGLSLVELRSRVQTLKRREPDLGLVVVDYLQLMTTGRSEESRLQEVSAISRGLKSLAKDLDVPVIALSQLSRAVEQRTDKRPILSDLRESGGIEQDADLVIFLYRHEYYAKNETDESDRGMAEVAVAKHRNGPTDTVKLAFISRYAKFSDPPK